MRLKNHEIRRKFLKNGSRVLGVTPGGDFGFCTKNGYLSPREPPKGIPNISRSRCHQNLSNTVYRDYAKRPNPKRPIFFSFVKFQKAKWLKRPNDQKAKWQKGRIKKISNIWKFTRNIFFCLFLLDENINEIRFIYVCFRWTQSQYVFFLNNKN